MTDYNTIAESNNFIVLEQYSKQSKVSESYQTEYDLESEFIQDLVNQGYQYLPSITNPQAMLANVREQLQMLNNVQFTAGEWQRFVETFLDKPSDGITDKTRKIHDDYIHDFVFDDGRIQNIYLLDKKNLARNKVQVIKQFERKGTQANRYDVTILVNGLPLVQIELKKRGVAIREAFNQVHRYSKESFNAEHSLYKYLQLFVISNGTDTRYFANTTQRNKNSFDFTMNWAEADNNLIKDLKNFTTTFFQKNTLLNVLLQYAVFDVNDTLLVMRPYQIAATERILWKINSAYQAKHWSKIEGGGYIWHTTGSGKTLTSFKAARLATELDFIDKVFFVVDRKDLDYQTMKEYQRFSPDSVNGSDSTAGLKRNLDKDDNKIIVTTIQKLNNLMKTESDLALFGDKNTKNVVLEKSYKEYMGGFIRANLGNRAKESLIVDFINQTNLDEMADKASIIDTFFKFAQAEQAREADELIRSEGLNEEAAKRYINVSLKREFASENGTELNSTLPQMSPLNPQYKTKKQSVFQKIAAFVEKFKGVGGQI